MTKEFLEGKRARSITPMKTIAIGFIDLAFVFATMLGIAYITMRLLALSRVACDVQGSG